MSVDAPPAPDKGTPTPANVHFFRPRNLNLLASSCIPAIADEIGDVATRIAAGLADLDELLDPFHERNVAPAALLAEASRHLHRGLRTLQWLGQRPGQPGRPLRSVKQP